MKEVFLRKALALMVAAGVMVFMAGAATAKTTAKDEQKLKSEITLLNKDASLPRGDQIVTDRLIKEFKVTGDQITALRDKKLGYGEIAAVYAFADKLSGGITDDNVSKVTSMVKDNKGWMTAAKDLDVDLGHVAGKVGSIEKDAHKDIKKASTEKTGRGEGAGGGTGGSMGKDTKGGY